MPKDRDPLVDVPQLDIVPVQELLCAFFSGLVILTNEIDARKNALISADNIDPVLFHSLRSLWRLELGRSQPPAQAGAGFRFSGFP
jgi:hypothetical protein